MSKLSAFITSTVECASKHVRQSTLLIPVVVVAAQASYTTAATLEEFRALDNTWTDAGLKVDLLTGDNSNTVAVEEPVRYQLTGAKSGACYLIHVDAGGQASLLRPEDCGKLSAGNKSHFPASGNLSAAEPWGQETVFAFMLNGPLPAAESLLSNSEGFASLDDDNAREILITALNDASNAGQLAMAETQYDVLQYRTRGIIKAVIAGREEEPSNKEKISEITFAAQSINFAFGSDELTDAGIRQLDQFGQALASPELSSTKLQVAGHTDDLGDPIYNVDLSTRRAAAVGKYLQSKYGIHQERILVTGHGEDKPLVNGASRDARAKNRRVEMVFSE